MVEKKNLIIKICAWSTIERVEQRHYFWVKFGIYYKGRARYKELVLDKLDGGFQWVNDW